MPIRFPKLGSRKYTKQVHAPDPQDPLHGHSAKGGGKGGKGSGGGGVGGGDPYHHAMSFGDHLEELRARLIMAILGLVPIFAISLYFGKPILAFLAKPLLRKLEEQGMPANLMATGVGESFGAYVQISVVATILVGSPWALYQLWSFVAPGLYRHEKRFVHVLLPMSVFLTICGTLFLYFVVLPVILTFFLGFPADINKRSVPIAPAPEGLVYPIAPVLGFDPAEAPSGAMWINDKSHQLRMNVAPPGEPVRVMVAPLMKDTGFLVQPRVLEYVRFLLSFMVAFSLAFQTPVVVLLLGWAGLVQPSTISKYRKHAILTCAILCAVLTPPDPASMVLLLIPTYGLYELGLVLLKAMPAKKLFKTESEMDGEPDE